MKHVHYEVRDEDDEPIVGFEWLAGARQQAKAEADCGHLVRIVKVTVEDVPLVPLKRKAKR